MFLIVVRQDVNTLESSVVVQELELAINLALRVFYGVLVTSKTWEACLVIFSINTFKGCVTIMPIDNNLHIQGSLHFIGTSANPPMDSKFW